MNLLKQHNNQCHVLAVTHVAMQVLVGLCWGLYKHYYRITSFLITVLLAKIT